MATLLEAVNAVITENGICGGVELTTFLNVEPEVLRLIKAVIQADVDVQGAWHDWAFMWGTNSPTVTAADYIIPYPSLSVQYLSGDAIASFTSNSFPIKDIDRRSMIANPGTTSASSIPFIEWDEFWPVYEVQPRTASTTPGAWTMKPDRTMVISGLAPTGGLPVSYSYYMLPRRIPQHIDAVLRTPGMSADPASGTVVQGLPRTVVELAAAKWARADGRFGLMSVAMENYKSEMEQLRAMYGRRQQAHSQMAADLPLVIEVN